jgi:hypothetical protein
MITGASTATATSSKTKHRATAAARFRSSRRNVRLCEIRRIAARGRETRLTERCGSVSVTATVLIRAAEG